MKKIGVSIAREMNKMRKFIWFFVGIVIIVLLSEGCSKRVNPSETGMKLTGKYDSTAFDYVFTEAIKQKFLGNAGDALKYLEQCIKINPESDAAYFEIAQIMLMLSDPKSGKKYALKAASINEENLWYLTLVASIYYQEKNLDSAIMFYEKIVKNFPEKENLKLNLASIYSENNQYEKAAEIYNEIERKYGVNETTSLSIIKNMINARDYKKAEEKVKKLLIDNPDEILYNGLLAEIYRDSGKKEEAVEVYNKLLDKDPGNSQTLISLSDFLLSEKQYDDLFPVLRKIAISDSISREIKISLFSKIIGDSSIIKSNGNNLELTLLVLESDNINDDIIILLRPELLVNENRISNAITRLEEIIKDRPENYYAWERLLFLYSDTKNWDKLLLRGEECATRFNRSYIAKVLYATAAMEKGSYDTAAEELKKAKILAGNDTGKLVQVMVMDADILYRRKEFMKSFETFKEALRINPNDEMILNNYAYYLAEQGQELKEAERMAKIVIEKEKGNSTYMDTYAWVLYKRGRYKEAGKIMEEIINKSEKEDAEWYEHLGYILKALKNCDKAIEYWKLAYKIDNRKNSLLIEIENCQKH